MSREELIIHKIFNQVVSKYHDKVALQIKRDHKWQEFTYRELETEAKKVATFLIKAGLKRGDYIGIILENRPEWSIIYLGIMYAGLACVPLDPQLSQQDLKNFIFDCDTRIIFCSYNIFVKKISQDLKERLTKIVVLDVAEEESQDWVKLSDIESILPEENKFPDVEPEDIASLIYTSGTTGKPKGVLLTHKNICSNFRSIAQLNICFLSDNFLSILPLHHTYPFMVTLIVPLFIGAKITYCPLDFKPQMLTQIIKEAKVTILVAVPQLFSLLHSGILEKIKRIPLFLRPFFLVLVRKKLSKHLGEDLRLLVSGGARLEPKVACDLSKLFGLKLIEGYGLTETSPVVTLNPPDKIKFGSVGKAIPDVTINVHNPDKSGIGQVLIRGSNVMLGYFKQPGLTSSVIRDGWFYSGDLGYVDKDGYLFITGREKEVIILSSGKTIYPEELEDYYCQSPYIKEICILEKGEKRFGHEFESLYAVVVPDLEYFQKKNESNIRGKIRWELENLAKELPNYKHIMGFTITKEELPRTTLKKIKRYQLKEKYLEGESKKPDIKETIFSEQDLKILNQNVAKKIISYLSNQLKKPVYLDSHLELDLGIDSLTRVELGLGLEALFSIKIPDDALYTLSTVKDVILRILELVDKTKRYQPPESEKPQKTWNQILKEKPKKKILKKFRINPYLLDILITFIFKNLLLFIFRIICFLRVKGKENLPKRGPFILCPNHASYLDGFVVFCSLPMKLTIDTFFLGYSAIFEHSLVSWAIKLARLIPIDPNVQLTEAMQAVSFILSHKKIVCIFPEGGRSIDEKIKEFKKGVGILIKELDILAVPVYIKGSHQSWPRGVRLPRPHPLKIIFGRPFSAKELLTEARRESFSDDYEAIAQGLREEVVRLSEDISYVASYLKESAT